MSCCGLTIEAHRNADLRKTYSPRGRNYTFSGFTPLMQIRDGTSVLLSISLTPTANGSAFTVVGDSLSLTLKKTDILSLAAGDGDRVLSYDIVLSQGGVDSWFVGGDFIVLDINAVTTDSDQNVTVDLNGQSVDVTIAGGNIGVGASVLLADLNAAVESAEQSAEDAAANGAIAGATSGAAAGTTAGATAGASAGTTAGTAAANAVVANKADTNGGNLDTTLGRAFLDALKVNPISPENFGAIGTGLANDLAALNAALATGKPVRLKKGAIYRVDNTLTIPAGAVLFGEATIRAHTTFTDQFVVAISAGTGTTLEEFTVDGQSPASGNTYGIRVAGSTTNLTMQGVTAQNVGFIGIDLSSNTRTWTHTNARLIDCAAINCPWIGINVEGGLGVQVVRPYVRRTGYDAIAFREEGYAGICSDADVSKATAPFRVFSGNPEKGMLLHKSPDWELDVIGGNFIDNRNAGEDGIGVGEDGTEHRRWSVRGAYVKRTGLFGIDPAGNCVCEGNTVELAGQQGIHLGLDLGGVMKNIVVANNIILDANDTAGDTAILIGSTLLSAPMAVSNVKVSGNVIVDRRGTKKTLYAFGVDSANSTFSGLSVTNNDFRQVGTSSFLYFGTNGPGADYQAWGNQTLGFERRATAPVPTSQGGALGTVDRSALRHQRVGKTVEFTYDLELNATTGAGTGTGSIIIPLPVNSYATTANKATVACSGVSFSSFQLLNAFIQDNNLYLLNAGGSSSIANGLRVHVSGSYEAASAS